MAFNFENYKIWSNAGTNTAPGFIDSGWPCGPVDFKHWNWWMNRADLAIVDLDERVSENRTDIDSLTTQVEALGGTALDSGMLGYYVSDSSLQLSKYKENSPGFGDATVLKTFNHTIQAEGEVQLMVGYQANVHVIPLGTSNCTGHLRLLLDNKFIMSDQYGSLRNGNPRSPIVWFGGQTTLKNVHANYNWSLIGQAPFPAHYTKGQNVSLKLDASISSGHSGTIGVGFIKLVIIEVRKADV